MRNDQALDEAELHFEGTALSPGIAIGKPLFLASWEGDVLERELPQNEIADEITRYRTALERSSQDLRALKEELDRSGHEEGAQVIESHLHIAQDPFLNKEIEEGIHFQQKNAEFVLVRTMEHYFSRFSQLADPLFRSRYEDMCDIAKRLVSRLREIEQPRMRESGSGAVLFSHAISPSTVAEACLSRVAAFVSESGGSMSHSAIVAKSKGIPYVTGVDFSKLKSVRGALQVIVDGLSGKIILNPTEETLGAYRQMQERCQLRFKALKDACQLPSTTIDDMRVRLLANVEATEDFALLSQYGVDGVGLFRSEYLVLGTGRFPSEEDQFLIYRRLVAQLPGRPVVIRVFDIGLDKLVRGMDMGDRHQFPVQSRAIRFLLKEKALFHAQLRAILRASCYGDVRILFPMICSVMELLDVKEELWHCQRAIVREGRADCPRMQVGCMIELPCAAMITDLLAKECDFLSVGTNDLVQYALAMDRVNQPASALFSSAHPGVIRLLQFVVREATRCGLPVSVCGELASDPRFVPLLLGLGVTDLSCGLSVLPGIKHLIRNLSKKEAEKLVAEVLALKHAGEIQKALLEYYEKNSSFHQEISHYDGAHHRHGN